MSVKKRVLVSQEFVDYIREHDITLTDAIIMKYGKDMIVPLWYNVVRKVYTSYNNKSISNDKSIFRLHGLTLSGEVMDLTHTSLIYYNWVWAKDAILYLVDSQLIKMRNAVRWSNYSLDLLHLTDNSEVIMFHTSNRDINVEDIDILRYNRELGSGFYMIPYVDGAIDMWQYLRNPRTRYRAFYVNIYALKFLPTRYNGSSFINAIGGQCIIKTQE